MLSKRLKGMKRRENNDEDVEDVEDDDNEEFAKKLDEYFGGNGELDENKMFLKDFFKNKIWIDKKKKKEVDDRVMGHSRKVEGSVRKKENARKEQRKSKEERMKIAKLE
ncbi:hypothetical protein Q3G72_023311 [Acer saccharum]|nr:hypothetical protein Q3G72_023311 [Acer saccharum]